MTTYQIHALPGPLLDEVRRSGRDTSGNPVAHVEASGGEPVRCCLRDAAAGERLILFGYEPVLPAASPYREIGAVFAHAEACDGPASSAGYPADWYGRPQVLRAYDERGWIHPSTRTHDGADPEGQIKAILDHPEVVEIHSRNIAYGCFMFAVTR
ncbi:DUF1203 domain-containing protein [Actinoplanes sp. NPDC051633]|uniref:DUF1203 domain-containing protein n=1 Tax=Actinoplanes sp. NPDC051633 TaxID=3155670 RepID=UPI003412835D